MKDKRHVARSRSIHGPWDNCPNNPVVRTVDRHEAWWSRGHATPIEGPNGDWWMIYHGYENGFRTLGRQCLLDPIEWTADGWFRSMGGDLSKPMPKPIGGQNDGAGLALSDDFSHDRFGLQWAFYKPAPDEMSRVRFEDNCLIVAGKGSSPTDCSPITCVVGDRAYEATIEFHLDSGAEAGLLLFIGERLYVGMGHDGIRFKTYRAGAPVWFQAPERHAKSACIRISNIQHVVTIYSSFDGRTWTREQVRFEASAYNASASADGESLRLAIYSAGAGSVRFKNFTYRALAF